VATGGATTYTVQWGDWLNKIAGRFGVSTQAILAANPGLNPNYIYPGQVINIPAAGQPGASPTPGSQVPPPSNVPGTYTVQRGDWFYAIARKFSVGVGALQAANPMVNPNFVYPGQVLNIPSGSTPGGDPSPGTGSGYTVRPGDTLFSIALRLGKTVYALQIANHLPNPNFIYPGQTLVIP
jgi:LysM repeat protein